MKCYRSYWCLMFHALATIEVFWNWKYHVRTVEKERYGECRKSATDFFSHNQVLICTKLNYLKIETNLLEDLRNESSALEIPQSRKFWWEIFLLICSIVFQWLQIFDLVGLLLPRTRFITTENAIIIGSINYIPQVRFVSLIFRSKMVKITAVRHSQNFWPILWPIFENQSCRGEIIDQSVTLNIFARFLDQFFKNQSCGWRGCWLQRQMCYSKIKLEKARQPTRQKWTDTAWLAKSTGWQQSNTRTELKVIRLLPLHPCWKQTKMKQQFLFWGLNWG